MAPLLHPVAHSPHARAVSSREHHARSVPHLRRTHTRGTQCIRVQCQRHAHRARRRTVNRDGRAVCVRERRRLVAATRIVHDVRCAYRINPHWNQCFTPHHDTASRAPRLHTDTERGVHTCAVRCVRQLIPESQALTVRAHKIMAHRAECSAARTHRHITDTRRNPRERRCMRFRCFAVVTRRAHVHCPRGAALHCD